MTSTELLYSDPLAAASQAAAESELVGVACNNCEKSQGEVENYAAIFSAVAAAMLIAPLFA